MADHDPDPESGFFPQTPDLFEAALCHDLFTSCKEHEKDLVEWRRRIMKSQHITFCHVMLVNRDARGGQEIREVVRGVHDLLDTMNPHSPRRWSLAYTDCIERALAIGDFDWSRGWRSAYFMLANALIAEDAVCFWALQVVRNCDDSEQFYRSQDHYHLWFRHVFGLFR